MAEAEGIGSSLLTRLPACKERKKGTFTTAILGSKQLQGVRDLGHVVPMKYYVAKATSGFSNDLLTNHTRKQSIPDEPGTSLLKLISSLHLVIAFGDGPYSTERC